MTYRVERPAWIEFHDNSIDSRRVSESRAILQSAYPFLAYEEHQPVADTALPAKMPQGPEEEPAVP
jgi:hypothetical protein